MVVAGTPVGHDETVESPLVTERIQQQFLVFIGVSAVYTVVGGHDGFGFALFDGDFKTGQVNFPQSALVHHGVCGHTAQLLRVGGEMLGAGGNAGRLNTADIGGCHFACKIGVFGEILEVSSAQGAALDVQTGSQQDVDIICGRFPAQILTQLFAQSSVPAVCHGGGSGETGGGDGFVQTQIVCRTCLLAQTVRTVGQEDGGKTHAGDIPCGPHGLAL